MKTIYLAGGCFWGLQKFFDQFEGIISTQTGYANGNTENPTYEDVKHNHSGHTETVKIEYDESVINLTKILEYYFLAIDPYSLNKQGEDEGENYRIGIYYDDDSLLPEIKKEFERQEQIEGQKFVVELLPLKNYYSAEEYHQKYLEKNPSGYCHLPLKLFTLAKDSEKTL